MHCSCLHFLRCFQWKQPAWPLGRRFFCKSCFWWVWDVRVKRGHRICCWFTAFVRPVFRCDNGPKVRRPTLWRDYVRWPVRECFLIFPLGNEQRSKRKQRLNLFCSWGHEIQNLMKEQVRPPVFSRGGKREPEWEHLQLQHDSAGPSSSDFWTLLKPSLLFGVFLNCELGRPQLEPLPIRLKPWDNTDSCSVGSAALILLIYHLAQWNPA